MKDYKTTIIPIIAVVSLAVSSLTGHVINQDLQDEIASISGIVVGGVIAIWGIFKNHKKEGK